MVKNSNYSAKDIEILEGLEPVRKRPGMYIGGTDETAFHHLATEIIDNSMDEVTAGYAKNIQYVVMNLCKRYGVHPLQFLTVADFIQPTTESRCII